MTRALVVGEALIDRLPGTAGLPGGSPANVAVTLGRLGRPVSLLTRLGEDADAERITSWLDDSGVELAQDCRFDGRTSVAIARPGPGGDVAYEFDLTWEIAAHSAIPDDTTVLHTGSIAATLEPGAAAVEQLVRRARPTAVITYDPNVRPSLMGGRDQTRARVENMVRLADVVKVSDSDLGWLAPGSDPAAVGRAWLDLGTALVVITCGGAGAIALSRAGQAQVEASPVDVVDTVGAGDTFMGALIDRLWTANLLGAGQREPLQEISPATMTSLLQYSAAAAAVTVARPGADPPYRHELPAAYA